MREHTAGLTAIGGDHVSTEHLKQALYRRMKALEDSPDVPLFFGRLDYAADLGAEQDETLYIGRRHVTGEAGGEPMVIDWRAGMSRPFYQAQPGQPMGVRRRRRFGFSHGRMTAYEDEDLVAAGGGSRVGDPGVGDRAPADRADARHRRHHPARAGHHRPGRPGPVAVHPGRARHRQDGGRAAPRRVPAVRIPRPAGPLRGAGGRTQRQLLVLHRRRAAGAWARSTPARPRWPPSSAGPTG